MTKKRILFVAHHLTVGGSQKSMITTLNSAIDFDKCDVTLYLRKKRLDLLNQVDKRVNIIVNDDKSHYYRKMYAVFYLCIISFFNLLGKKEKSEKITKKLSERIRNDMLKYEMKHFLHGKHFDIAIAYVQGYTSDIIAEIDADKKYMFYHSSTDEAHELHEKIFPCLNGIIAVSETVKDSLKNLYPDFSDKISVIENYVDEEIIIQQSKEYTANLLQHSHEHIICSCGRFSAVKGFDLALKAAKILKEKSVKFIWYFIGDGPEKAKLEEFIEVYDLQDCIVLSGIQKNPYPWINECHIYVQPSYEEAFGLTIAEAKILGKPVVSTATVGGCSLIKDEETGIITEISAQGLADGILKLIENPYICEKISENLKKTDYGADRKRYKTQWENLLDASVLFS